MKRAAPLGLLAFLALAPPARAASFTEEISATEFLKGNLHAHSNDHSKRDYEDGRGDGDSKPNEVLGWYAGQQYKFASLTDHNELTSVSAGLTVLPGIELTSWYGKHKLPVHVNALCATKEAKGVHDINAGSGGAVLQQTIDAAKSSGASIIVINHPTYDKALDKAAVTGASGFNGIELASGHPQVERDDAAAPQSAEDLWDDVLTDGSDVWGFAADDSHDFGGKPQPGESEIRPPGKAWVQAWAKSESAPDLCDALAKGHFYASTGPALKSLTVRGNVFMLEVAGQWDKSTDKIEFIAKKTAAKENVIAASGAPAASYFCDGSEGYVRARVTQGGKRAWTQAYRVK